MYVFPAEGHPEGTSSSPWFSIEGDDVYSAYGHPDGISGSPWYTMHS